MANKFLVVLGPSRSGTTVLTSVLNAHPDIHLRYEVWHSANPPPPVFSSAAAFNKYYTRIYGNQGKNSPIIGFKETVGGWKPLKWVEQVLENIELPITIIVILRDPAESYLSGIDGAKKWWGNPDKVPLYQEFVGHVNHTSHGIVKFAQLIKKYGGAFVSYKAFSMHTPIILPKIMDVIGVDFNQNQLAYHKKGAIKGVMGDMGVATNPQPVSPDLYVTRAEEARRFVSSCENISEIKYLFPTQDVISYIDDMGLAYQIPNDLIEKLNQSE